MASSTYKGFNSDNKLIDKSDYHAWKMSLDLALEYQDVMDYVKGNIQEHPSNVSFSTKMKYRKGKIKAKMIIRDSIHKHWVAYISELKTSKEMYNKLVSMFRASNANQIFFFKNQLNNIKKGKDESIQSYFMKIGRAHV